MTYSKQDVLKLLQTMPDESFDLHQLIQELAYRLTLQQRLEEAERGQNCISDEEARTRFGKWLKG